MNFTLGVNPDAVQLIIYEERRQLALSDVLLFLSRAVPILVKYPALSAYSSCNNGGIEVRAMINRKKGKQPRIQRNVFFVEDASRSEINWS